LKRIAILIVLAVLAAPSLFAGTWFKTLATAQREAKKTNQLIFVDLFADWCGWCHRLEREVFPSEGFQNATRKMILLRIDTEDGDEGTRMARELGVQSLPTSVLLAPDGTIAGMIRGYSPAKEFATRITEVEKEYERFRTMVASESSFGSDYKRRLELAREFMGRRGFVQAEARLVKLVEEKKIPAAIRDEAYYDLAFSQLNQKKYDNARKTIEKFHSLQKSGEALERSHILMGESYLQQGNYEAALASFKRFRASFPKSPYVENVNSILPQIENAIASKRTN